MKNTVVTFLASTLLAAGCTNNQKTESVMEKHTQGEVEFLSPDSLHKNPAYSQAVTTKGTLKTVYIGGQNAVDKEGKVVGKGDLKAQSVQALKNMKFALAAGGASLEHVIKWNVFIVQGQDATAGFQAIQEDLKKMPHPPIVTAVYVAALAQPDFLVEMDAIAVVPE